MKILLNNGLSGIIQAYKTKSKRFLKKGVRLKTLVKDVFVKRVEPEAIQVRHKGDVYKTHIPEFIQQDGDVAGITVRKMKFSPEETEKMSKMPLDDMMSYKANLIEKGKYTYED